MGRGPWRLAYNLRNFLRRLELPAPMKHWTHAEAEATVSLCDPTVREGGHHGMTFVHAHFDVVMEMQTTERHLCFGTACEPES